MNSPQHQQHKSRLEGHLKEMPHYIIEYVRKNRHLSPSTLLNYVNDYEIFFKWLMTEGIVDVEHMRDIPLSSLERLKKRDVEYFIDYLNERDVQITKTLKKKPESVTSHRKVSALKSLFNFLTTEPMTDDDEPFFYRNVMHTIKLHKKKDTLGARAADISAKILHGNDDREFLQFIASDYIHTLEEESRKRTFFERDKERDIAILSLFLGSGLRVNELASIRLKDIDYRERIISIMRKGNKKDVVTFSHEALDDILAYKEVRNERYGGTNNEYEFLFLVKYGQETRPLSVRSIQSLVAKYTGAFNKSMSPHKLRHTFATKHYGANKDPVGLMSQLGHTSSDTTILYTNPQLKKSREAIDRMSEHRDDI